MRALAALVLALAMAGQAHAQQVHGLAELRLGTSDGEESWLDGGFGKGGKTDVNLSQAVVEYRQSFGFSTSVVVSAQYQPDVSPKVDLDEAYLKFRAPPASWGRVSARAGVFYPPVSQEHTGVGWTTPDTISASAINTWIGEEVKVGALEATFERNFGDHEIAATAAVFGWNDTSGTLLTFRGWSLGEVRTGRKTEFELPPLSPFMATKQADETYPMDELDHRAGYYGRLEWRPPAPVSFNATYYDNKGDLISVKDLQWAWETQFLNLGMAWEPNAHTRVLAQAMGGRTLMGYSTPRIWANVHFRSAYVLASRQVANETLTGRLDWFEVNDRTWQAIDNNDEDGWAATAAWRHPIIEHADLLIEAQHIDSERPSRALAGEAARQDENLLQAALRLSF
jgi:hypothetical protein